LTSPIEVLAIEAGIRNPVVVPDDRSAVSWTVVLEAAEQTRGVAELARTYSVHPVQISQWKRELLDAVAKRDAADERRPTPDPRPVPTKAMSST
jgi:hypothetical protein